VVTHPTTNRPAYGLSMTERTGSPVFHVLWSIAEGSVLSYVFNLSTLMNVWTHPPEKSLIPNLDETSQGLNYRLVT
jgi:hypothetical protein